MPWYISPYILAIAISWLMAHIIKLMIALVRGNARDFYHQLFISGGMPSSHTATSVSVWWLLVLHEGVQSPVVGLATLLILIVCYDAVKVRRSSGEQGVAVQQIIQKERLDIPLPRAAQGHTPLEVCVGAVLGTAVALIVFFATR